MRNVDIQDFCKIILCFPRSTAPSLERIVSILKGMCQKRIQIKCWDNESYM